MHFGRVAFYPTLAYNLFRNYVQPDRWAWYSRINDSLIVGAMPFTSMVPDLENEEQLGGVLCCTETYELEAAWGAAKPTDWSRQGVEFHHTPMRDFIGTTSQRDMEHAVEFIDRITSNGKTCYVHCKAGRTRSATVAICYLMHKYDHSPEKALALITEKRPQVALREAHRQTITEFRRVLDERKSTERAGS